jgi:plasmid maintenance system antidote protein VapI
MSFTFDQCHGRPFTPARFLQNELEGIGLTAKKRADVLEVPPNRLYQLGAGKRNVTADTAWRLGQYFGEATGWRGDTENPVSTAGNAASAGSLKRLAPWLLQCFAG